MGLEDFKILGIVGIVIPFVMTEHIIQYVLIDCVIMSLVYHTVVQYYYVTLFVLVLSVRSALYYTHTILFCPKERKFARCRPDQ